MAGMPQHVLQSAKQKLKSLEATHGLKKTDNNLDNKENLQLSFFNLDDPFLEKLSDEIKAIDIDTLTPVEALMHLNKIKKKLISKN